VTTGFQFALGACAIAGSAAAVCVHHATYGVRSQWLGPTDWRGPGDIRSVALTFDDGPAEDTERILDSLAALNARATFFLIGLQVERHPAVARRIVSEGHEVGNHSYSHPIFLYRSAGETRRQLERTQDIIADTTGVRPRWSRPPCGVRTPAYFRASRDLGLRTVQWTVAGFDWKPRSAHQIVGDVVRHLAPGSIVLLHDGDGQDPRRHRRETVAAVPKIIAAARDRDLAIDPLARLLDVQPTQCGSLQDADA
jgi:peptidoglycan/xylan/chitin deacetylase (PgdA/CDA1 family)